MFVDIANIHIESGAGGNGKVAWRREKYVPFGGPAGGDGAKGGDIFVQATSDINTLLDFKFLSTFKAEDGEKGGIKNMSGKNGQDLIIRVPLGTIIRDSETGNAIADLKEEGERVLVAAGGRGGRGNARFTSSQRQSPQFSEPGEPAIIRDLILELKLLAEVGIIGLPNAGKSTLISVISAAKPKIAAYPFTTLIPNLGVVQKPNGDGVVVADIPGLVEGASEGIGLGHEFLRHVERTRLLMHLVDASQAEDVMANFDLINNELSKYNPRLAKKPQIVVLSKTDTVSDEDANYLAELMAEKTGQIVFQISAATNAGVDVLKNTMFEMLANLPKDDLVVPLFADLKAMDNDDSGFEIVRDQDVFTVVGGKIDRLFSVTDMQNVEAVMRMMNIFRAMGIFKALREAGAEEGHQIAMGGLAFDYAPDEDGLR